MEKRILPFSIEVEMQTYLSGCFSLGAIKSCIVDYDVWLCNKLINCNSPRKHIGYWNTEDEDLWSTKDGCTFHQLINIAPESVGVEGLDIIKFNIEMIKRGYYVSGNYNEFYIPGASFFSKRDMSHGYILWGFDNQEQIFKSATYLSDGTYGQLDIKYDDYFKAVINNCQKLVPINYYRVDSSYKAKIDVELVKSQLRDYMASTCSLGVNSRRVYGVDVWESLVNYVTTIQGEPLDLRYIRAFMEHKVIMHKRIMTLTRFSYIHDCNMASEYNERVCDPAKQVFSMAIKYNITHNADLLIRIADKIRSVNLCEQKYLLEMLVQIEK